eukprot:g5420.t1
MASLVVAGDSVEDPAVDAEAESRTEEPSTTELEEGEKMEGREKAAVKRRHAATSAIYLYESDIAALERLGVFAANGAQTLREYVTGLGQFDIIPSAGRDGKEKDRDNRSDLSDEAVVKVASSSPRVQFSRNMETSLEKMKKTKRKKKKSKAKKSVFRSPDLRQLAERASAKMIAGNVEEKPEFDVRKAELAASKMRASKSELNWASGLRQALPAGQGGGHRRGIDLRKSFALLLRGCEKEQDGILQKEEFAEALLSNAGIRCSGERAAAACFEFFDTTSTGELSWANYSQGYYSRRKSLGGIKMGTKTLRQLLSWMEKHTF